MNPPTNKPNISLASEEDLKTYKYKYALDNSSIGIWEWDMVNNKMHYSEASKIIHGYENSELDLLKRHWREAIHPEDLESLQKAVDDHIQNITPEYKSEHRILYKEGSYKWVLDFGKIVAFDEYNAPKTFIGTTIDITQRKEDEERLRQDLSVISNQNKKLANFAHIVSHNLKEHAGNFESLLSFYKEANNEDYKDEIVDLLMTVSDSLTKTIDNLREVVSKQSQAKLEIKPLRLNDYINKVIDLLELDIVEKNVIIKNKVSDALVLYSNETYLESIILNLASNALKYSHPERQPVITIDAFTTPTSITITLEDNGLGIDLVKYGHDIFGLYKTFHNNSNAEGIGLYLTKNQIEALGGEITVESIVDEGTKFIITIAEKKKDQSVSKSAYVYNSRN
ncbi:MAG: PAS domain-containing sensor histidine kinase [Gelidibacter sp.]|uniref:sensor histidine kinase n=1 Tax=Gelidibacter sp. TaxID=2018083 RepID=UPI0032658D6E